MITGNWTGKEGVPYKLNILQDFQYSQHFNINLYNVLILNTDTDILLEVLVDGIHLPNLERKFERVN